MLLRIVPWMWMILWYEPWLGEMATTVGVEQDFKKMPRNVSIYWHCGEATHCAAALETRREPEIQNFEPVIIATLGIVHKCYFIYIFTVKHQTSLHIPPVTYLATMPPTRTDTSLLFSSRGSTFTTPCSSLS